MERRWTSDDTTETLLDRYGEALEALDAQVGRLMRGFTELGLHRDTLVVLIGDHGLSLMEHGRLATAQFLYEPSIRVPLMISWWNRLPHGRRVEAQVSILDVPPTLFALGGVAAPPEQDGTSLLSHIDGTSTQSDARVYLETFLPATLAVSRPVLLEDGSSQRIGTVRRALRTTRWKLIRSEPHALINTLSPARVADAMRRTDRVEELYDLANDPTESVNLIGREADHAASLRAHLDGELRAFGLE
jgi:arylsulfatase A-like enzyme